MWIYLLGEWNFWNIRFRLAFVVNDPGQIKLLGSFYIKNCVCNFWKLFESFKSEFYFEMAKYKYAFPTLVPWKERLNFLMKGNITLEVALKMF